jgi:hypothetical protein
MPVTAKLSKQFYDRLGEAVTNELVDWFNQVDAAYKSDLREMNEMNFVRFDAKLEQRFAEFDAKFEQRFAESRAESGRRFGDNDRQFNELRSEFRAVDSNLRLAIERGLREQTRFFFLAWAVLLSSIIALRFR